MTSVLEQRQAYDGQVSSTETATRWSRDGVWGTLAALSGAIAIASVPIFTGSQTLSIIPQALALLAACFAISLLAGGVPRFHPAIIAHGIIVAFWGVTLLEYPDAWEGYQTLLKVTLMGVAAHIIFRSPKHLALLFAIYGITGLVALAMNLDELSRLGGSGGAAGLGDKDRFAGTFVNPNAAGIYGIMLILSSIITFLNLRSRLRWPITLIALCTGLTVFFFSGSRKGMLGLAFLLALAPWLAGCGGGSTSRNLARVLGFSLLAVAAAVTLALTMPFMDRLIVPFTQGVAAESSSEYRLAMITRAIDLWVQHPVVGCGFDGFSRFSEFGVYSHSTFSEILCNSGVFGLLLFGVFYGLPGWQLLVLSLRAQTRHPSPGIQPNPYSKMPLCLLAFWGLFGIFSMFAVL